MVLDLAGHPALADLPEPEGPGELVRVLACGLCGSDVEKLRPEHAGSGYRLHYEELTLRGAFHHAPRHVRAALAFLASGAYPWERLITHEVELEGVAALLADPPRDYLKAAVRP